MLPFLLSTAFAHVPHDTVRALVAPADGDRSAPWFALLDPQGTSLWARSDDGGGTWELVGGAFLAEDPRGAALLEDGTIGVLGEGFLWVSEDAGETWAPEDLPGEVEWIRGGPGFELAGASGLFTGVPGDWKRVTGAPVGVFGPGAAWAPDEGVWALDGGVWTLLPAPSVDPTAVAAEGNAYAGTAEGEVMRWDGAAWAACGALGKPGATAHDDVVRLLASGGRLYAATGSAAPYVADADCAVFSADSIAPIEVDYSAGNVEDEADAWTGIHRLGDHLALAGWSGIALSDDDGEEWVEPLLIPPDFTRGLAFAPGFPVAPELYASAYAAAVQITADGGRTWTSPSHGIAPANAQWVQFSPSEEDVVYAVVNHIGWVSRDRGISWTECQPEGGTVRMLQPLATPGRVWAFSDGVEESVDGCATWAEVDALAGTADGTPAGVAAAADRICLSQSTPSALVCSADGGATWERLAEGAATGRVSHPVLWPPGAPTRALWGDGEGVRAVELSGGVTPWADEGVTEVAAAADGALFAGGNSGQLYRSDDGGETWAAAGERLPARVQVLAARPDWTDHPELLAGTHAGTFVVSSGGDWEILAYQRIDDASAYVTCAGCPEPETDTGADLDAIQPLTDASRLKVLVRGEIVQVRGRVDEGASFALFVDDEEAGVGPLPATEGVLARVEVGRGGWHKVAIVGMAGPVARVDTIEAWGDGAVLDLDLDTGDGGYGDETAEADPPDEARAATRCGCGGGKSIALVAWAGAIRRRRAQEGA